MKRLLLLTILLAGLATALTLCQPPDAPGPLSTNPSGDATQDDNPGPRSAFSDAGQDANQQRREVAAERTFAPMGQPDDEQPQGVKGWVEDQQGRRLGGVPVFLFESANNDPIRRILDAARQVPMPPAAMTETDRDGQFWLGLRETSEDRFEVHVLAQGFARARSGDLHVHAGEWLDIGGVALAAGTRIHGRVTIAGTGLPAPQATVVMTRTDPFQDISEVDLATDENSRFASVDNAGNYELRHVPRQGQLRLTASAPGFARQFRKDVTPQDQNSIRVDFELPVGKKIAGLLETSGQPLGRVDIEAWPQAAEPAHQGTLDPDGRFEIEGLSPGNYLLRINAKGFLPVELKNVAAGSRDLRVPLKMRGRASVVVRDPRGQVLRNYRLSVRRYFEEHGGQIARVQNVPARSVQLPANEERAEVQGLELGQFVFQVQADGYTSTLSPVFRIGEDEPTASVTMVVNRGATLTGLVQDQAGRPVAGAEIRTQPAGAADENPVWRMMSGLVPDRITRTVAETDAAGQFTLRGLAHASYQLMVTHPQYCRALRRDLELASDESVRLAPIVLLRGAQVGGQTFVDGALSGQVKVILTPVINGAPQPNSADETTLIRVEAISNNQGGFTLPRRVPPGTYTIRGTGPLSNTSQNNIFHQFRQMTDSQKEILVQPGQELVETEIRITTDQ
ncbi:MAG: carboxypeptidase-like regulatory domain-containing protein [Planctomycetota bacterium]|nr:carboxypeptidase-like regulatory domain-containing protein [Planctomycetota bacterium]